MVFLDVGDCLRVVEGEDTAPSVGEVALWLVLWRLAFFPGFVGVVVLGDDRVFLLYLSQDVLFFTHSLHVGVPGEIVVALFALDHLPVKYLLSVVLYC